MISSEFLSGLSWQSGTDVIRNLASRQGLSRVFEQTFSGFQIPKLGEEKDVVEFLGETIHGLSNGRISGQAENGAKYTFNFSEGDTGFRATATSGNMRLPGGSCNIETLPPDPENLLSRPLFVLTRRLRVSEPIDARTAVNWEGQELVYGTGNLDTLVMRRDISRERVIQRRIVVPGKSPINTIPDLSQREVFSLVNGTVRRHAPDNTETANPASLIRRLERDIPESIGKEPEG